MKRAPLSRKAKAPAESGLGITLEKLAYIPYDVQGPILLRLDEDQLMTICQEKEKKAAPEYVKRLGRYCNDAEFWQSYLISHKYRLPDNFPEIINVLRKGDSEVSSRGKVHESEASVIQNLFFGNKVQQKKILDRALASMDKQLALDVDYLWYQINDRKERKKTGKPRKFILDLEVPEDNVANADLQDQMLDELFNITTTSYPELLQYIVDYDMEPGNDSLVSDWLIPSTLIIKTQDEFQEQALASIGDLLQEGDIVGLELSEMNADPDDTDYFAASAYFYFDGEVLHPLTSESGMQGIFLPKEAIPFLDENKIEYLEDLNTLYDLPNIRGFESRRGDLVIFTSKKSK